VPDATLSRARRALEAMSVSQMVDHVLALPEDSKLMILAPVVAIARASNSTCSPS